ncbi:hypothetical protein GGH96_002037 [Coemansia sp. RSA 1972]|nr:hypothetical protein GGH96_002037 [Coemansia sp. RSA 1972]
MLARLSVIRRAARTVGRFHTGATHAAASQFTMPALSPTMTEGGIARWEKKEGEAFAAGDLLLQIETDKAQMDVEAQDDGVLVKILAPEGAQNVRVNSVIAIVAEEGDDIASIDIGALSKQPEAEAVAETKTEKVEKVEKKAEVAKTEKAEKKPSSGLSSPAAEFTIHANHIANAAEIEGTGPKGRVLKGDVLQFLKAGKAVISKPAASKPAANKPVTKAAPSGSADLPFLVQSLEPSVLRHLAQVELAKRSVVVQVPATRLVQLVKANRSMAVDALAVRAIALALQASGEGNGVGVVTDGSKVAEVAGAATASVLDLAQAIKQARSGPASGHPAAVLAGENVFTPDTLPEATVVVVGAPYASVSAAEASAAMDSALNDLLGVSTSSAQPSQQAPTVIDVRVISNSPTVASALASKIKGFLSNPELLTF